MTRNVILTEDEWRQLPLLIAEAMHEHSVKGYGFKVVDRESGQEIGRQQLGNWWRGTMAMVMAEVETKLRSLSR